MGKKTRALHALPTAQRTQSMPHVVGVQTVSMRHAPPRPPPFDPLDNEDEHHSHHHDHRQHDQNAQHHIKEGQAL